MVNHKPWRWAGTSCSQSWGRQEGPSSLWDSHSKGYTVAGGRGREVIYAAGHHDDELGRGCVHGQDNVQKPLATKVLHFLGPSSKVSPHRRRPADLPCQGRGQRRQKVNHLHQAVVYSSFSLTSGAIPLCLFSSCILHLPTDVREFSHKKDN